MASTTTFHAHTKAATTAAAFPSSITDKVILITGVANTGIGGATAKALAAHSPRLLILAGRSFEKVAAVIADINEIYPDVTCRFLHIDLSSQTSVRKAAAEVRAYADEPLHILINNAAVMNLNTRTLSDEPENRRAELQFATNHLGPFLLTNLLLPKLLSTAKTSPPGTVRIINLSSSAHAFSPIRFSDLDFSLPNDSLPADEQYLSPTISHLGLLVPDGHYVPIAAYAQSKTANILFTIALNARFANRDGGEGGGMIRSFAVHPGSIDTGLQRHADQEVLKEARKKDMGTVVRKTLEEGASTTLVAALDPQLRLEEGEVGYLADCAVVEPAVWCKGEKGREDAERLWRVSEGLVGEEFVW